MRRHTRQRRLPDRVAALAVCLTAATWLVAPGPTLASGGCPITVLEDGDSTIFPALQDAQSDFQSTFGCSLTIAPEGSGIGINSLLAGSLNVAASSRPLQSVTETNGLIAWPVAGDAMVIAVRADSAMDFVDQIDMAQVKAIYEGSITSWNQLKPTYPARTLVPRSRTVWSGSYSDLITKFGVDPALEAATVQATGLPRTFTSYDQASAACSFDDQIVYTSLANLKTWGPEGAGCLKALALAPGGTTGFVMPSVATVLNATYPAPRQLFLALRKFAVIGTAATTDDSANVKAQDLVNYFLSPAGQAHLSNVGFANQSLQPGQALPDFDVNLDGAVGLADLGNVTGRWNQSSACPGWIRADVNNDGAVGLPDIGRVTAKWGQVGFVAP